MSEKFPHQPTPETTNKDTWLKELNSKKTRDLLLTHISFLKMGFSSEDVEDAVQQTMFKAAKAIKAGQFDGGSKLITWLKYIAKNTALDLLRRKKFTSRMISLADGPELTSGKPTSEEILIKAETRKGLNFHLNNLPPKQREVIELLEQGLGLKQIAKQLGVKENTIKSRKRYIEKYLQERMKK